jgi:hypothetical protein
MALMTCDVNLASALNDVSDSDHYDWGVSKKAGQQVGLTANRFRF